MNDIISTTSDFIQKKYEESDSKDITFHTLKHTKRTVEAVILISEKTGLSKQDQEILILAAWFHDVGILESYDNHEAKSAEIATKFLKIRKYPDEKIIQVIKCIKATNLDTKPQNILEKVIRDADVIHLGKKSFFKRNKELREEIQNVTGKQFTDKEWIEFDLKFLTKHKYFTEYAHKNFDLRKRENMEKIKSKQVEVLDKEAGKSDKEIKKMAKNYLKSKTPDRGIETMFRLTSKNHFTLSSIADSKASTLISISALIISIIISVLIRKLDTNPELIIPTVLILITLMGTIIFAVLSTRPTVTSLGLTKDDINQKKGNLLYFGNFITMPVQEYEWGMQQLMDDREYLYNNLIRDIYYLGVVLGKKYRYLKYAYNIFMYGLIISVIAYIFAFAT